MRAAAVSSRISAEPAFCPTATFFTGQPKLISTRSAPSPTAMRAASAIAWGSHPASCTAFGPPPPHTSAMRSVLRFSRTIAQDAIISDTTMAPPCSRTSRRNGRSVTPDIGASTTGSGKSDAHPTGADGDRAERAARIRRGPIAHSLGKLRRRWAACNRDAVPRGARGRPWPDLLTVFRVSVSSQELRLVA